jgi:hypothetical protein
MIRSRLGDLILVKVWSNLMSVNQSTNIDRQFPAITARQFQQLCEDNPDWRLQS